VPVASWFGEPYNRDGEPIFSLHLLRRTHRSCRIEMDVTYDKEYPHGKTSHRSDRRWRRDVNAQPADRPNALATSMMEGLLEALPRLAEYAAVGAIVLTGAGCGFCAGGDLKSMAEESAQRAR
jgi:1,4-dihydroxy-2-naphthoyl-CoA synthase